MRQSQITYITLSILVVSSFFVFPKVFARTSATSLEKDQTTTSTPIIIILPHQDDELFMAGSIQRYQKSGRDVRVVMVSDGGASKVRHILNGKDDKGNKVFSVSHGKTHNPFKEGYKWFTRQRFSAARNREFIRSMKELGIPRSHIEFMNSGKELSTPHPVYRDGDLRKNAAKAIEIIQKKYGDGTYVTLSGGHSDHVALEEALFEAEGISEKIFFPYEYEETQEYITLTEEELAKKQKAISVYEEWKPREGKFSIGGLSVNGLMEKWRQQVKEYFYTLSSS